MDHAVSLVQAYLQLNGYFTSAEYPIIAGAGRNGFRTITDIDILAFRFPSGVPVLQGRRTPQGLDITEVDDGLGVASDKVDMIIGEVKEGRVGINSGPVVAGVIGRKRFLYDLWGDAVNTASRMESHGTPGRIQITQATFDLLKDEFRCEPRGTVAIKGKGDMETWYLLGRQETVSGRAGPLRAPGGSP